MDAVNSFVSTLNGLLFHEYVVYTLLATGLLFTLWSGFGQYRALTHGMAVIRGKYDHSDDPGAINHFQALSAALSATVGLGNIAGVALAVALGGPGAVFWMWVIGVLGMALKMTEVTQSMLYRNVDDPKNPHGGPMFVVKNLLASQGGAVGVTIGGIFCLTLVLSAITGGNMFQAWNVADVTTKYFDVPGVAGMEKREFFDPETFAIGILLALIVGVVIIGGVKRIGAVAGRVVPLMCGLYLAAGLIVVFMHIGEVPAMIMLIISSGLGLNEADPAGAFIGGAFGFAMLKGIQRALFSSEAGQGSSPIAHSAAKCNEPVREGVVAGIEPFIDTIVVCTVTALVLLTTGAWNREAEAVFSDDTPIVISLDTSSEEPAWIVDTPPLPDRTEEAQRISRIASDAPQWSEGETLYMVVEAEPNAQSGNNLHQLNGTVVSIAEGGFDVEWKPHAAVQLADGDEPAVDEEGNPLYHDLVLRDRGVHVNYAGAALTAHAFDRAIPGLGMFLVVTASWLFAISTMISWSYYGEQGVVYLFGDQVAGTVAVTGYRLLYVCLIAASCIGFIKTDTQLDMWTTLGLGAMLIVNIPIMWIFGSKAMNAYHAYIRKLKNNEFES